WARPGRSGPPPPPRHGSGRARAIRFSAVDELGQAEVSIESPEAASVPCSRSGDAFLCRTGRAEPAWHEVLYQPVRCLFILPPGGPARIAVRFPEVPAGTLLLGGGHAGGSPREGGRFCPPPPPGGPGGGPPPPSPPAPGGFLSRRRAVPRLGSGDASRPGRRSARARGVRPAPRAGEPA